MNIRIGTFNLNNLFSRFNLYTEADAQIHSPSEPATTEQPREWLDTPHKVDSDNVVEVLSRGEIGPDGKLRWLRTFKGKLIHAKKPEAQKTLAKRIKELGVDVLAVQEVENLTALEDFVHYLDLEKMIPASQASQLFRAPFDGFAANPRRVRGGEAALFLDVVEVRR